MTQPFVSICLLTYKRAELLPRSLDALLGQTYGNFELVINDDCSPDETEKVGREYEKRDARVRYCRNETNQRYAGNQNAAISRAKADFVAIVHDGDIYRTDCIEQWVRALEAHPNAGIVYNATDALDHEGRIVTHYRHPYPPLMSGKAMIDEMLRFNSSPIFGIVMVRKCFVEQVGPFDMNFPILADVDMWMRLLMVSDVAYVNEPLFQISPRESDHVNASVNWKIIEESQKIFSLNARRRFADDPHRLAEELRALQCRFDRQSLQAWLWCLKRRNWRLAGQGVGFLSRSPNSLVKGLGRVIRPFFGSAARRGH